MYYICSAKQIMEDRLIKKIVSELQIILDDNLDKIDLRKNFIFDCLEIVKDLFNSIDDVVFIFNSTPSLLWVSQSVKSVLGYSPQEYIRNGGFDFINSCIHPDDKGFAAKKKLLVQTGGEYSDMFRIKHKDGNYIWLNSKAKVFKRSYDGIPYLFMEVATDISDIINARDKIDLLLNENKKLNKELLNLKLSKREREIMRLISEGFSGKRMADELKISFNTVRTHRANIMLKTNSKCMAEIIKFYREFIAE